ncbi:MAG TPA: phosphoribosyltransferase family protein [Flavobacteriaceae bacterium]|nr:phosphoribosyltransferase family protein [Flavobacteriaceae bacterium]
MEELLCSYCLSDLPLTHFHTYDDSTVLDKFYGLLPAYQATALLYFIKKGISQKLLHKLKYEDQQNIGTYFGKWLGSELKQIPSYLDVEVVVPVPLHKKRFRSRGYNQVTKFAKQIASQLDASYCEKSLIKISHARSQVGLGRWSRFGSKEVFKLGDPSTIRGKHVLLVDDLIATGATLINCGKELLKAPVSKLSIATLAMS